MTVQGTVVRRRWVAPAASIALVVLAVALLKMSVFDVIAAARRHEASVSYSLKAILLAPGMLALGVYATVASLTGSDPKKALGGSRLTNPTTQKLSVFGWVVVLGLLAVGGALYLFVRSQVAAYGYDS